MKTVEKLLAVAAAAAAVAAARRRRWTAVAAYITSIGKYTSEKCIKTVPKTSKIVIQCNSLVG